MTAAERKAYIAAKLIEARALIAAGLQSGLASGLAAAAVALDSAAVEAPAAQTPAETPVAEDQSTYDPNQPQSY